MKILKNVSLKLYSTMRLGGHADYVTHVRTQKDLLDALDWAKQHNTAFRVIGGGSNIIWKDEGYRGLLVVNEMTGFSVSGRQGSAHYVTIGAGEPWDQAVAKSVELGLHGIELLSLIPGTSGATPVQNVGAYGTDISKTLVSLDAYDTTTRRFVTITNKQCAFGYRTSRFKTTDNGRYIITSITLRLDSASPTPPFYDSLQKHLTEHGIDEFTPRNLRNAVIAIRSSKLPDPAKVANNGSFFANPIIEAAHFQKIVDEFPDAVGWELPDGRYKVAAGWLLEKSGFRGYSDEQTGMATWPEQALVLVNRHAKTTADLIAFRDHITTTVKEYFEIQLEQEPELLP